MTTQSATKIHAMDTNYAAQTQTIALADDAYLEFLPDPVIPHRKRAFRQRHANLHLANRDASLFGNHSTRPKHHHPDECFGTTVMSLSTSAARSDGSSLFSEKLLIDPLRYPMRQTGVMDSFDVLGNVIVCTPKAKADRIYARIEADVDLDRGLAFGACRLPNDAGLVFKVLGRETAPVKAKVREFWGIVRKEVTGANLSPPFLWR